MIKSILIYLVCFGMLFLVIHFTGDYFIKTLKKSVRFSTWDTNIFLSLTSLLICVHFQFFSLIKSLKTQLGFIYLPTLFIKGALFYTAFKDSVFSLEVLNTSERLSIIIPLLLFLTLEVYFIIKIISKMEFKY